MIRIISAFILAVVFISCSPNNVNHDKSLGKFFEENKVEGCFALYNNVTDRFTIYNLDRYKSGLFMPGSTFDIVNALIGLQTGVITSDSLIRWDSIPYHQEVARRIGKDSMQLWLDTIGYAAGINDTTYIIRSAIDSFWLDNSLKVTPDDQLGLVRKLYFNQLPFFKSYQEMIKRAMVVEDNANYKLSYKTGGSWLVGWVEENRHSYFFVLNLESADKNIDTMSVKVKLLKDILKKLGFLEGKM
jgi:beta-lactamase class D